MWVGQFSDQKSNFYQCQVTGRNNVKIESVILGVKMQPKVSIIILNWNGYDDTIECLESLQKITYKNYDMIMVDNGSDDGSYEKLIAGFSGKVFFIRNKENLGFAGGNNVGIRYALAQGTDYVLLLNNDTVVSPNFLGELVNYAEKDMKIGCVGPKILCYNEPTRIWYAGGRFSWLKGGMANRTYNRIDRGDFDRIVDVDYIPGCALLAKSLAINAVGLLDEEYFNYNEESDWCFRLKKTGFRIVFVFHSKIWHKGAKTFGGNFSPFYMYYKSRNRLLLIKKNFSKVYLSYCIAIHILLFIPSKIVKILFFSRENEKALSVIALIYGFIDFLSGKTGPKKIF